MRKLSNVAILSSIGAAAVFGTLAVLASRPTDPKILTGPSAFTDYTKQSPGTWRKITVADLPKPHATASASNGPDVVARPERAWPKAPEGFKVELYASSLDGPRKITKAPNGDLFVSESDSGKVRVF